MNDYYSSGLTEYENYSHVSWIDNLHLTLNSLKIIKMGQVYWKSLLFLFHFQISKLKNICAAIAFSVHFDSHRFSTLIDVFLIGREIIVSKNNCKFSSTINFLCLLVVSANYLFDIFGVYWL